MKKLKDLKNGDYLYFYRDNDYSLKDVEKCVVTIVKDEFCTYLKFSWGMFGINIAMEGEETIAKVTIGETFLFYTAPPKESHYAKNRKRRIKVLYKEMMKLQELESKNIPPRRAAIIAEGKKRKAFRREEIRRIKQNEKI